MDRSYAGFIEAYILSMGALDEYAAGLSLPSGSYVFPVGIASPKELDVSDFNPPKDGFGNILNNKKNFLFDPLTFNVDWAQMEKIMLFARNGGCDLILVSEGVEEYEGDPSGIEAPGGGVWWRRSPDGGIYFFEYANRSHMGIGWEYTIKPDISNIKLSLEAAISKYKAGLIKLNSITNAIVRDAITMPGFDSTKQFVLDLREVEMYNGSSWVKVFDWDEINDYSFVLKTVSNKRPTDNRELGNMVGVDFSVTGADARPSKIYEQWSYGLFRQVKFTFEKPDGTLFYIDVKQNTISNAANPKQGQDKREGQFTLQGNTSILRVTFDQSTYRTLNIGL